MFGKYNAKVQKPPNLCKKNKQKVIIFAKQNTTKSEKVFQNFL